MLIGLANKMCIQFNDVICSLKSTDTRLLIILHGYVEVPHSSAHYTKSMITRVLLYSFSAKSQC